MKNQEIANILYEIAYFLETDDVPFKPYAYEKAAITIENLKEDIEKIYIKGGRKTLEAIPGIGESTALKIEEFLKTGKIKYYENLKRKLPVNMDELIRVEGLGPKKIKTLHRELGISNLKQLEVAAKKHKIAKLFGFGPKAEKNILEGIRFLKRSEGRFLLGEVFDEARIVYEKLKALEEVERIDFAGSIRRMKETIGDVDFLVSSKRPEKIMDFFVSLPGVGKIWNKGKTKASVRMKSGFDMDIRILPQKSWGSALQYFTGSKEHNIALRKIALEKKLKLSEYGLFRGSNVIAAKNEENIYRALGMDWIPPEMRENRGEIELALKKKLPEIICRDDIRGDFHCHTEWDGGANTIKEMAWAAIKTGYEYIGIADHTKFLKIERGLNEQQLARQRREIDRLNSKFETLSPKQIQNPKSKIQNKFRILQGCEANILNDGSIDIKDEALKKLDYVIAGVHSNLKMDRKQMTERIITAMKNPHINIIAHPTGRIINKREECEIDFDKILRAAKETKTILEINSNPKRLDLNDINIKRAKDEKVKMIINSDAHDKNQLHNMKFGIFQARRGWAEKTDIVNSLPLKELMTLFNEKSKRYNLIL